jgi:DNA-binding LacI/PurR family transcriptional regulator
LKPIPFKIDRNNRVNIPEQLANGFRMAIRSGYYKQGEKLPSFAEIVEALDISIRAPRDAMKILIDENLVRSRPRIGCEVMARGEKVWKGRVLGVVCAAFEGSYYISILVGAIRKAIIAAGYSFIPVTIDRKKNGRPDFSQLDAMMKEPVDFVIAVHPDDHIAKRIVRHGVPALAHVDVQKAAGLDVVRLFSIRDIIEIARKVRPSGIRKVLLAEYAEMPFVADVFMKHGIDVERLKVKPKEGFGYLEDIKRKAFFSLRERLSDRKDLPDLILFTDDFVAFGGLMALVDLQIRVPQDVKVLTMANKGFAPVFPVSLAQVVIDPIANGVAIAEAALAKMENRRRRPPLPRLVFLPGDSLPTTHNSFTT